VLTWGAGRRRGGGSGCRVEKTVHARRPTGGGGLKESGHDSISRIETDTTSVKMQSQLLSLGGGKDIIR